MCTMYIMLNKHKLKYQYFHLVNSVGRKKSPTNFDD